MGRAIASSLGTALVVALSVVPATAEERLVRFAVTAPADGPAAAGSPVDVPASAPPSSAEEPGEAKRFIRDVLRDYKNFFSVETAIWLGVGSGAALAVHPADQAIHDHTQGPEGPKYDLKFGVNYGEVYVQLPLSVTWWIVGAATGSEKGADAGRDLLLRHHHAVFGGNRMNGVRIGRNIDVARARRHRHGQQQPESRKQSAPVCHCEEAEPTKQPRLFLRLSQIPSLSNAGSGGCR